MNSPTLFEWLPEDILVQICQWLNVRDVLALRSSSKRLFNVTKNSTIWTFFLRCLTLAVSPAQSLSLRNGEDRSSNVYECFVSHALRLEQSWKDYNPRPKRYQFNGHQRILAMSNLPGGKYMVTVSQEQFTKNESIVIWDMNFRGLRNHVAIALLNSETPVKKLQVRYAVVKGQQSLLTAFTRPPVDGKTMVTVTYITLETLETLSRLGPGTYQFEEYKKVVLNPFSRLLDTGTRYPVGAISLSEIGGSPLLATVHRPRTVAFYFLDSGTRACLKLAPVPGHNNLRHSIWNIKILSSQNQILVIRVLINQHLGTLDTYTPILFEVYDIPSPGAEMEDVAPCSIKLVERCRIDGVYVSDAEASWWYNNREPMVHLLAKSPPPPISIFVTTREPRGFLHYLMLPQFKLDASGSTCVYDVPTRTHAAIEWKEEEQAVIIPGAYRSIIWMRSRNRQPLDGIEVLQLAVYRTEGYRFSDAFDTGRDEMKEEAYGDMDIDDNGKQLEDPRNRAMKYPVVPGAVARAMRQATLAMQFDEWLGRLCVSTTEDTWVQVLDWSL